MNKKKGFTLVELIATVALMCLVLLLVVPNILSRLTDKTDEIDAKEVELIEEAARVYVDKYVEKYPAPDTGESIYCISISDLKEEGIYTPDSRSAYFASEETYSNYRVKVTITPKKKSFSFQDNSAGC